MELPILIWNIYPDFEHPFQLIDYFAIQICFQHPFPVSEHHCTVSEHHCTVSEQPFLFVITLQFRTSILISNILFFGTHYSDCEYPLLIYNIYLPYF